MAEPCQEPGAMEDFDLESVIQQLQNLHAERAELLTQSLSPEGAWIHEYTKKRTYPSGFVGYYTYAKWQADKPIFERKPRQHAKRLREKEAGINQGPVKDQHIGRVGSNTGLPTDKEVIDAYSQWNRRKRLEKINKALGRITNELAALKVEAAEQP